jgi:hypothetical protein
MADRYDNPISLWFLAPIYCLKIPTLEYSSSGRLEYGSERLEYGAGRLEYCRVKVGAVLRCRRKGGGS